MKKIKNIHFCDAFSLQYAEVITDDDAVKGVCLHILKKAVFTVTYCNNPWIDEYGKPYNFKLDTGVLYLRRMAINFKWANVPRKA